MQPNLEAVARKHAGLVDLVVLDATKEMDQAASLGVLGTPTLIAVNDGAETARFVAAPRSAITRNPLGTPSD